MITPLLKPGRNELRVVSYRVANSVEDNNIKGQVGGPAEWYADRNQYLVTPIVSFEAKQGWAKEPKSGQLVNPTDPKAESIEHTIAFMVKSLPQAAPTEGATSGSP